MAVDELTYVGLGDMTYKEGPNGEVFTFGTATSPTLDLDKQVCDPEWLNKAVPGWMETGGNLREQHNGLIAAGVGMELAEGDDAKWQLKAEAVDAGTKEKIKKGVLKGYSIGIKGAQIITDKSAPNGRIVGGDIVEISWVDRPANPDCRVTIAKSVNGEFLLTKADGEPVFTCPRCAGIGTVRGDMDAQVQCPECDGSGKVDIMTRPSEAYTGISEQPLEGKSGMADCSACKGTGMIQGRNNGDGKFNKNQHVCKDCMGSGKARPVAKDAEPDCKTCGGTGKIREGHVKCPDCDGTGKAEKSVEADINKAPMSQKKQNDLPDSDFAYIEPGGKKDEDGKTVPREKRHFPVPDAAHVRNALARAPQSPFGAKAMPKIKAAAKKFGVEVSDKSIIADIVKSLSTETFIAKDADEPMLHDPALLAALRSGFTTCINQELGEMDDGTEDEFSDVYQLLGAYATFMSWWCDEANEDETTSPYMNNDTGGIMSFLGFGIEPDLVKAVASEQATDEVKAEFRTAFVKSLSLEEDINKAAEEGVRKVLAEYETRLQTVEKMAAPVNISKRAVQRHDSRLAEIEDLEAKAASYRQDASQLVNDPIAKAEGLAQAEAFVTRARLLRDDL